MRKKISIAVVICLIIPGIAGSLILLDMKSQLNSPLSVESTAILNIKPGASLKAIGNELVKRGWMEHSYYLVFTGRRQGMAGSIKTGEYEIRPGMTPIQLLSLIVSGRVIQYSLTIPEGWTVDRIIYAVQNSPHLEQTVGDMNRETIMGLLGHPGQDPEGRFFPDTYLFPAGTKDIEFLARAYDMMDRVLTDEWLQRDIGLPYKNPYQALIMASIIEKETAIADERYKIAGVFVRRLLRGMKLQTDPTVIYAIGKTFNGDITRKDLNIDSPYNTYRYEGLPPTPIAAPGRESIRAALHPEQSDALYFVATGDGRHYFSETLAEHNKAVTKYQINDR